MPDRAQVFQLFELGVEGTAGTEAARSRLLRSLTWSLTPQSEHAEIAATGFKVPTLTYQNREWSSGTFDGAADYNELPYILNSALKDVSPTVAGTAAGGTTYQWTYEPDSDGADDYKTYTFCYGDANHGELVTHALPTSYTLSVTRQDATISGNFIGHRIQANAGVSGTAAVLSVDQAPVTPGQWSVYLDDSSANLGNTKLLRDFSLTISIPDRFTAIWPVNAANTSFDTVAENAIAPEVMLQVMPDTTGGSALINSMRQGDTKFLRAEAVGGSVTGGTALTYKFTNDFALQVISAPSPQEVDALHVWEWTFRVIHDGDWGKFMSTTLVNELAAL